jgi:hypothetical protein
MAVIRYASLALLVALGLSLTCAPTAHAQTSGRSGGLGQPLQSDPSGPFGAPQRRGGDLPEWARPSQGGSAFGSAKESEIGDMPWSNNGPTLPGAPNRVPVDGGLVLLALAGAGYATRRLRRTPDGDEA